MRVYVGQTRSRKLIAELAALGIGECTCRGELPSRRTPWFYDNGAFTDWRAGRSFDAEVFELDFASLGPGLSSPDFVVCPDLVAGGTRSLEFSLGWVSGLKSRRPDLRYYLAVQDGMSESDVAPAIDEFCGLFVGGTMAWKIATGSAWVRFAHERGIPAHVGRCGTPGRVSWGIRIGADSIDSSLPLWSRKHLARFLAAIDTTQPDFGYDQPEMPVEELIAGIERALASRSIPKRRRKVPNEAQTSMETGSTAAALAAAEMQGAAK